MKKLILGLLIFGLTSQVYSQIVELDEVVITATNYKYLNAVDNTEAAVPVKMLERQVAKFDLKKADFYLDEYDFYNVTFFIPEGKILVAYDKEGNVLRTVEKFKDIKLPMDIRTAIEKRFPGWVVKKDVYRVTYNDGKSKRQYKVVLENGDKTMRVKLDGDGNFQ